MPVEVDNADLQSSCCRQIFPNLRACIKNTLSLDFFAPQALTSDLLSNDSSRLIRRIFSNLRGAPYDSDDWRNDTLHEMV